MTVGGAELEGSRTEIRKALDEYSLKWWYCKVALRVAEKVHAIARKNVLWRR